MRLCYSIIQTMALTILLGAVALLAGCGQKGPLYLPSSQDEAANVVKKAPAEKKLTPQKSN